MRHDLVDYTYIWAFEVNRALVSKTAPKGPLKAVVAHPTITVNNTVYLK